MLSTTHLAPHGFHILDQPLLVSELRLWERPSHARGLTGPEEIMLPETLFRGASLALEGCSQMPAPGSITSSALGCMSPLFDRFPPSSLPRGV